MKTIFPAYGLGAFREKKLTKELVIQRYGEPDELVPHKNYSTQMKYTSLGKCFYYQEDSEAEDPPIITLGFVPPFEGKTEDGIILNRSTMEDVFKIYGRENWLTADGSHYFWVEHSGISFYVLRNNIENPFPFEEKNYIKSTIIRITVPVTTRPDDIIRNEAGTLVYSADDYCVDGTLHEIIFDQERSERLCSKCGLIIQERIISMAYSGSRAFSKAEQDKRQTHGSPVNPLIPDLQMATMIDKKAPMPEVLRKAVKWDSRYSWKQRNMIQATSEIKRIGELLNLPNHVKVYAIQLYRKAFQLGLLKGRSIRAMVAASIYYACGAEQVPRTLQNIVNCSDSTFHQITKCYQSLIKELNLQSPTIKPGLLVSKYIAELQLNHQVEVLSQKILTKYEKVYSLSGKDPKGLVAAALYVAAQHNKIKVSQTKISRTVGITEVTLRNRLREMQKFIRKVK